MVFHDVWFASGAAGYWHHHWEMGEILLLWCADGDRYGQDWMIMDLWIFLQTSIMDYVLNNTGVPRRQAVK